MFLVLARSLIVFLLCHGTIAELKESKEFENLSEPLTDESLNETSKIRKKRSSYSIMVVQHPSGHLVSRMELDGVTGTFLILVDTGSSSIWVPSQLGVFNIGVKVSRVYPNPEARLYTHVEQYKQHVLHGQQIQHHVKIGDLILPDFLLSVVHSMKPIPPGLGEYEGVFGLAPFTGSLGRCESFCCWLKRCQPLGKRFFTLWFPGGRVKGYGVAELAVGIIEEAHYHQPLVYFQVTSTQQWSIAVTKIVIGERTLCENDCQIVLDTGTSISLGDPDELRRNANYFGATGQTDGRKYFVDCAGLPIGPRLGVFIGNHYLTWKRQDFALRTGAGPNERCYFGMKPDPHWVPRRWTFGHNLLKALYTVYDLENMKVGVAKAKFPA